jgi:hypothetical protein
MRPAEPDLPIVLTRGGFLDHAPIECHRGDIRPCLPRRSSDRRRDFRKAHRGQSAGRLLRHRPVLVSRRLLPQTDAAHPLSDLVRPPGRLLQEADAVPPVSRALRLPRRLLQEGVSGPLPAEELAVLSMPAV